MLLGAEFPLGGIVEGDPFCIEKGDAEKEIPFRLFEKSDHVLFIFCRLNAVKKVERVHLQIVKDNPADGLLDERKSKKRKHQKKKDVA